MNKLRLLSQYGVATSFSNAHVCVYTLRFSKDAAPCLGIKFLFSGERKILAHRELSTV